MAELYRADPHVEAAQPNLKYVLFDDKLSGISQSVPNDPLFSNQWHLHNIGQSGGAPDADIDAPEAWDIQAGHPNVIVSVMDTGQDLDHPDLVENLWVNPGEIPNNGIDDDNNGYVDDIHGWDHSDGDNDPNDYQGHGTHTAGTIAATTNNGIGVAGVAGGFGSGVKIICNKIFPSAYSEVISQAFQYAADNGAVISSNSWGYGSPGAPDPIIEAAIEYFIANAGADPQTIAGGVVIFAAGNDNTNNPTWGYPASYPAVIAVAATDHNDVKADFSNWGTWVDVSAPGVEVYSTLIGGYGLSSGTSMACPIAAGVAALIASQNSSLTAAEVRAQLLATTDNIASHNPGFENSLGSGRVNAHRAVDPALTVPNPPLGFAASLSGNLVNLIWNDPFANTNGSLLTDLNHINVYRNGAVIAEVAGGIQSYEDAGLGNGAYSYVVTAVDAEGTESQPSNIQNVIVGQIDALIWAPLAVLSAQELIERAKSVKGQYLTTGQAQTILEARLQSQFGIQSALTANGLASFATQDITAYNLTDFKYLFVSLGQFPANYVIQAGSAEAIAIEAYLAAGGKVYMEGGDVWYFDPLTGGHDFGASFGIDGVSDGALGGELHQILGACFTEGQIFDFIGGDNYPDHLKAIGSACVLHENDAPQFTCGVANPLSSQTPDGSRTIGASFEFNRLADGTSPATKTELIARYLEFFDTGQPAATGHVSAQVNCPSVILQGCVMTVAVTIDVSATNPGELLGSYDATLNWDSNLLQYNGFSAGNPPFDNPNVFLDNVAAGELRFSQSHPSGSDGVINVINVEFDAFGEPGVSEFLNLDFSKMTAAGSFRNLLPIATIQNCGLVIEPGCILGDVTTDNAVSILDALIIATNAVNLEIPPDFLQQIDQGCGDVTRDNETTIIDSLIISSFAVSLDVGPFSMGEPLCP